MSHPCSATAWHNNGMHGAPAAAKAVVVCAHHSLTMVRPAAMMSHSMRPRYKIAAVLEEYIMHAGSFSPLRYKLVRFERTTVVSSYRNSDDYCCHRPSGPMPVGMYCSELVDTTGLQNRDENVSRLIDCAHLRKSLAASIPVVAVWLFDTARARMRRNLFALSFTSSFARPTFYFFFLLPVAGDDSVR